MITTTTGIAIPKITDDMSTLDAAIAYAKAGIYVGPCKRGSKHPGSVIGDKNRKRWQHKTSRDPQVISFWYAGTDHGLFLHLGRSGLWAGDVDNPAKLHPILQRAIDELEPPYQATRIDQPDRGHYVFEQPPARDLGNGLGRLADGWGEARGRNGVIIVQPSEHENPEGRYQWLRTGPVPMLPDYVAELLPDALDAEEAATDAHVAAFLAEHRGSERAELLNIQLAAWQKKIAAGESRHSSVMGHIAGAMREAKAGFLDAKLAADTFQSVFEPAVMQQPAGPKQGKARSLAEARSEWQGILAWAVAQALAADPAETRERVAKEVPKDNPDDPFGSGLRPSTNGSTPPPSAQRDEPGGEQQPEEPPVGRPLIDDRKVADAAGRVRVAETKLAEVRNKPKATASQLLAAEEAVAAAQRRLAEAQHEAATAAQKQLDATQRKAATAQRQAATAAGDDSRTDDGNALRLVEAYGDVIRRISDMRRWHYWDGQRWALDNEGKHVRELQRELARQLPSGEDEEKQFKHNSLNSVGLSGAIRVAESDPRIAIDAIQLDSHPELLNTPSGIVDLRTGQLHPHEPSYLLTRITTYGADLTAPHPKWDRFLWETFGSAELIGYMRRLSGLALLGTVTEHIFVFLWGIGANGKGGFTLVLQGLLGDADAGGYAVSAPDGFLMTGREGKHETEMARLRGARLVVCSEQTSGKRFDEAKVKRLTGGDKLAGRFMRGDFFEFMPSHLIWVLSNHLPAVKEGGPSFWRRLRRIPFLHVVPEDQRVADLHEVLLKEEGPAILGWMVQGAVEVLKSGLRDPAAVLAATEEYQISEDSLASFVRDECLQGPHYWCVVTDFRERYEKHCVDMGAEPLTAKALTMRLTAEFGIQEGKLSRPSRRIYKGIGLQAEEEE
jgi:P4 family phage/plasmid primase-like protien